MKAPTFCTDQDWSERQRHEATTPCTNNINIEIYWLATSKTQQKNSNSWWRHLQLSKSESPSQLDSLGHMHSSFAQVSSPHRVNNSNKLVPGCQMHFGNEHRSLTDEAYNWQLNETEHVCAAGHRQERRIYTHYWSLHAFKHPRYVSCESKT